MQLNGVGFLRACLLAEPPNRVFLSPCERDARAPSTHNAGNAGVPPAIPTAREKTYPFKPACRGNLKEGASIALVFVKCVPAIGLPQASAACVDIAARVQEDIDSARFVASLPPRLRAAVELRLNQSVIAEWGASAASATAATARG